MTNTIKVNIEVCLMAVVDHAKKDKTSEIRQQVAMARFTGYILALVESGLITEDEFMELHNKALKLIY